MRPKAGDDVWFASPTYRGAREFSNRKVDKVGRKYFYVGRYRFSIDNSRRSLSNSETDGNHHAVAYASKEEHEAEEAHGAAVAELAAMFRDSWNVHRKLDSVSTDDIRAAIALLNGKAASDGE